MGAAPGGLLMNLYFVGRRMVFQVFAIIRHPSEFFGFDVLQRVSQSHFAVAMMMSIGFTIGCDVNELVVIAPVGKRAHEPSCQFFTTLQQSFKCDRSRNWRVIKEHHNAFAGAQADEIGASRIDAATIHIAPAPFANFSHAAGLKGRKNGELDSQLGEHIEGFRISRRFREPHSFWFSAKAELEIAYAPEHLRVLVRAISERKDHMVVHLGES